MRNAGICLLALLALACQGEPVDDGPPWRSTVECDLRLEEADVFAGTCESVDGGSRAIRLKSSGTSEAFRLQGTWWSAGGTDIESPERISRLIGVVRSVIAIAPPSEDLYRAGLVESYWGAYRLDRFVESDEVLAFSYFYGPRTYVRATPADLPILERARELLSDDSVWDRADDRVCDDESATWSLYCALFQATHEELASSHHHQPAMDLVREVITESYIDRVDGHLLMDFNNHAATTLNEVHDVIDRAEARLRERLR